MSYLKDKVVVVAGASSGIGEACAIEFAKKGASIVLAARRTAKLQEVKRNILPFNKNCIYVTTDLIIEQNVINLFQATLKRFGSIDILINSVGRGLKSEFNTIEYEDWITMFNTNLTSIFLCTKEASNIMIDSKIKGHIITISSLAGLFNVPNYSAYCAFKHAATSFKKSIKPELKTHGIKVSIIYPYKVETEFFDSYAKKPDPNKMLAPKDIADHIVAIAERNIIKTLYVVTTNILKRIYYSIRSFFHTTKATP